MPFKKQKIVVVFFAILAIGLSSIPAQAISEGGAIFLLIRPGARPSGMGSAFAAIADDATATYFNPAGLAFLMPEAIPYFRESDVRDWGLLTGSLQDKDAFYLFQTRDLLDPASIILQAKRSPALIVPDISDWKALRETLADTAGADPSRGAFSGWLDSAALQALRSKPDTGLSIADKWAVLSSLNRQLDADAGLYRHPLPAGLILSPAAAAAVEAGRYSREKAGFIPQDLVNPGEWAKNLAAAGDPLARHLWGRISPRAKAAFKRGLPADSAAAMLTAELNRALKGRIYQAKRFENIALPEELRSRAALNLSGEELAWLNIRLLEAAFPQHIALAVDYQKIGPEGALLLNRALLEARLAGIIRPLAERARSDSLSDYILAQAGDPRWETLRGFDGRAAMTAEQAADVPDFLNTVANGFGPAGKENLQALREIRAELESRFPAAVAPHQAKIKQSPLMHIRSLLPADSRAVCDKYSAGKAMSLDDKETLLGGLNQLLANRALYRPEYFNQADLDPASLAYIRGGVEYLTIDELTELNRRLLESALPAPLKRKVEPIPHYATMMHSPWLSGIWDDVGDMYYEFIAYAQPVKDWGVFGGNVIYLSEGTNQHIAEDQTVLGTFSSYEFSPTLTYANKIYSNLAGGVNLKLIYSHLAPFGAPGQQGKGIATTWAVDLGLLFHGPVKGLALGMNIQNIGPNLTYIDAQEADPLSRNLRVGTAYNILDGKLTRLTTAWDITKTIVTLPPNRPWRQELEEVVHHLGFEFSFNAAASLALRYGLVYDRIGHIGTNDDGNFDVVRASCFGAGVGYKKITFDFAMEPGGELQTRNKKFSLSAIF